MFDPNDLDELDMMDLNALAYGALKRVCERMGGDVTMTFRDDNDEPVSLVFCTINRHSAATAAELLEQLDEEQDDD